MDIIREFREWEKLWNGFCYSHPKHPMTAEHFAKYLEQKYEIIKREETFRDGNGY
jgi:hypothetical protein